MSGPVSYPVAGRSVMVTGGAGFIGAHLVRALVARGAREVRVLDHAHRVPRAAPGLVPVGLTLGATSVEALGDALAGVDYLFHLAALKHRHGREDPLELLTGNVLGTWALLAAARRVGVRKAVFASSLYAHGGLQAPPLAESDTPAPRTVYGISKLAGEHLFAEAHAAGLAAVSLRYFFVYGPGQDAGASYPSVIVRSFERLLRGEPLQQYGDGEQVLDYVYVGDVVEATIAALEAELSGELLNVGSGRGVRVRELLASLAAASGRDAEVERLPPDATAGTSRVATIERIRERLGWTPRVALAEGLARTWDALRSRHA